MWAATWVKWFCKQLSESSPSFFVQQGSCSTTVEVSDNIVQNLLHTHWPVLVLFLLFLLNCPPGVSIPDQEEAVVEDLAEKLNGKGPSSSLMVEQGRDSIAS